MSAPVSELVYALRLARTGACLEGDLDISRMRRLAPLLVADRGAAHYRLEFSLDPHSRPTVRGRVDASLEVICQRCLEPMIAALDVEVRLGIVRSEAEAVALGDDVEPLLIEAETVSLLGVVEDELILALPAAPLHPAGTCRPPVDTALEPAAEFPAGDNPFAVLSVLKRKKGTQDR